MTHHELVNPSDAADPTTIEQLGSLFRDELAATETYDAALHHQTLGRFVVPLQRERNAHAARSTFLAQRLTALGAKVPPTSGAWGTWVRLVTEAAASLSPEMALSVILEEEESLIKDYVGAITASNESSRGLLDDLLAQQRATHGAMSVIHSEAGR